ncbi:MAG TPA: flagellar protein FlaG [Methylophilaceae bacterium]|jgi:flagellar protein FlaG
MSINSLDGYYGYVKSPVSDGAKLSGNFALASNSGASDKPLVDISNLGQTKADQPTSDKSVKKVDLEAAVKKINDFIEPASNNVKFLVHQQANKMVVTMVDATDAKVLREIPSMEVMHLSNSLDNVMGLKGLGVKQSA